MDHIQALVDVAESNVAKSANGRDLLRRGRIAFVKADGRLGLPAEAPFDAIHVGAAAPGFIQGLVDQLKRPGRLVSFSFFLEVFHGVGRGLIWLW